MNRVASIFSLFCGGAMLVVWTVLLATGQVVEMQTSPIQTIFLLSAEFLTAALLILGGYGVLAKNPWGPPTDLLALGLLLYCAIYSIGFFSQKGIAPAAGFFVIITILTAYFSFMFIFRSNKGGA